jgi:RHS repeat-associated protein
VYDANGALLSDGTRSFTYDALGRLTGVSGPSLSASYTLDGSGNRLSETIDSATTSFDLDLRGLPSVLVAGHKSFLPGMPSLGHASSGAWLSSLTDAQGSVLQTIDSSGVTGTLVRYDPYGGLRPGSSPTPGIGYTGEWSDPTGLVNLRFRAYDPALGRFISRDTFGGLSTLPQSANRYAYALGNPLRYTDPSGHFVSGLLIPGLQGVGDSLWGVGEGVFAIGALVVDGVIQTPGALIDWAQHPQANFEATLHNLSAAWDNAPRAVGQAMIDLGAGLEAVSDACKAGDVRTCVRFGADAALFFGAGKAVGSLAKALIAKSPWSLSPFMRGLAIEQRLGGNLPANFPVIDRWVGGVATSIKSMDLTAVTYQNLSRLKSRVRGYVDDLAGFHGATHGGITIAAGSVTARELVIAVQAGVVTTPQRAALSEIITYATTRGVRVVVEEIP